MSHAASQTHATATQTTPHRLLYFFVAFVLLMFFGLIYAWSLFVDPLEAEFGWDRSATSVVFTLSIITFCAGMLVAGALEERTSPRTVMLITAACLGLGLIASAFTESLPFIYATYGVLVGAGVGLGTDVVMSVTLKWFPDKQGLASGAMLMGFGGGTMLLSPVVTTMLGALGWRMTFGALGAVFVVLVGAGAFIMKLPTPEYVKPLLEKARQNATVAAVDMTGSQMVRTPTFWVFMVYLMLVTCGGLALISQAVPAAMELLMGAGAAASGAATGVGAAGVGASAVLPEAEALMLATAAMGSVSAMNGLGRLINGFIWDKFGYRVCLTWIAVAFAAGMLCCAFAMMGGNFPLLVAGFMLLGLMYGGNMCSMSAMVGTFFGPKYYGINYAIATCQMIPAAIVGPQILALSQMGSGSYLGAFWVFFGVAIAALVISLFIKPPKAA